MSATEISNNPWDPKGVFLRLSKERKVLLMAIAKKLGYEESPHKALAAYIASSKLNEEHQIVEHLSEFSDGFPALDALRQNIDQRFETLAASTINSQIRIEALVAGLDKALATVLELLDAARPGPEAAISMAMWLGTAEEQFGLPIRRLALTRAAWIETKIDRESKGKVSMAFDADMLNIDGRAVQASTGARVEIVGIDPTGPLCVAISASPLRHIFFACQATQDGTWRATAFHADEAGAVGAQLESMEF